MGHWTQAAATLAEGRPYAPEAQMADEPPGDTGEARGLGPARLTLTFGFGPSLFGVGGLLHQDASSCLREESFADEPAITCTGRASEDRAGRVERVPVERVTCRQAPLDIDELLRRALKDDEEQACF